MDAEAVNRDPAIAEFFDNWALYRAVIDNNCMEHREIYDAVRPLLAQRSGTFTVLDLGCGDAAGIAPVLAEVPLARYVGVDVAGPALDFARELLPNDPDRVELRQAELMTELERVDERFDVILISFALHHFDSAGKQRFLRTARDRLAPGGALMLIDVVRMDGESRDEYLDRYTGLVATWPIRQEFKDGIETHIRRNDWPEEVSVLPQWAVAAGFSDVTEFYRGGSDTQAAWCLSR